MHKLIRFQPGCSSFPLSSSSLCIQLTDRPAHPCHMNQLDANFDLAFPAFHLHVTHRCSRRRDHRGLWPIRMREDHIIKVPGRTRTFTLTGSMVLNQPHLAETKVRIFSSPYPNAPLVMYCQEPRLFPHLNVLANLQYGWKLARQNQYVVLHSIKSSRSLDIRKTT